VPVAQLEIAAKESSVPKWPPVVQDVGITSRGGAALLAILAVIIAGAALYRFALYLKVPGPEIPADTSIVRSFITNALRGFSVPLRLISTSNGWASLSQLQILLWTFVVGAGAVYVMTLTGTLIAISSGALALLGIAGAAAVLSEVVRNLSPDTAYDFRVRTDAAPDAWSTVGIFSSGGRTPKWSDIVTDTDRPAEIDVTRVQMLFFTVISAFFVGLNIVDTGTIPQIDPTYVTLMGISNGVYVTAKFARP